jgi:TonB family protein
MPYERQILLSTEPVPRRSVVFLSLCGHLLALVLLLALLYATRPRIVPVKLETAQAMPVTTHLVFKPAIASSAQAPASRLHVHNKKQQPRLIAPESEAVAEGPATKVLRQHARNATAGMLASINVSQFYGMNWDDYQLAIHVAGELPVISPAELPPHFQQFVTVEVTIDVDGRVADARIIGGLVTRPIEQKLLAAIREFKYTPAKHYGTPIPSQVDVVVHIPS